MHFLLCIDNFKENQINVEELKESNQVNSLKYLRDTIDLIDEGGKKVAPPPSIRIKNSVVCQSSKTFRVKRLLLVDDDHINIIVSKTVSLM